MRQVIEIEDAVNGMRINISSDQTYSAYKENTETRLQALNIAIRFLQKEIIKEEQLLKKASGMI